MFLTRSSGEHCHLIHLTILRRFSWPSLTYVQKSVLRPHPFHLFMADIGCSPVETADVSDITESNSFHSFIHSFIHPFIYLIIHLFIHSFIHSEYHVCRGQLLTSKVDRALEIFMMDVDPLHRHSNKSERAD